MSRCARAAGAAFCAVLMAACSAMPGAPPRADMGMVGPVERGPRQDMKARFEKDFSTADKDGDGALTKAEMEAGMPIVAADFARMDANGDGKVTRDEMQRFLQGKPQ